MSYADPNKIYQTKFQAGGVKNRSNQIFSSSCYIISPMIHPWADPTSTHSNIRSPHGLFLCFPEEVCFASYVAHNRSWLDQIQSIDPEKRNLFEGELWKLTW